MKFTKVALATAFVFGSIAAISAQGNSPAAKSNQGAASSPSAANSGATMNDTMVKGGGNEMPKSGMSSGMGMKSGGMGTSHRKNHRCHKKLI